MEGGSKDERVVVNVRNPDKEFTRNLRESIDQISEFNFQDARKSSELPPMSAPSIRSSMSDDSFRRSMRFSSEHSRPLSVLVSGEGEAQEEIHSPLRRSLDLSAKHSLEEEQEESTDENNILKNFPISHGLTTAQANDLVAKYGRNELPEKVTPKWFIFLSLLWQPMPVMIWVAAIVEIIIDNYIDMAILVMINLVNASLSFYETTKAGDAIAALKASLKPTAICMRDGKWNNLFDARLLVPGDLVELCSGGAVPADCMINSGTIDVDESAMTGESLPVTLRERQMAKMGGTVVRGETHATIIFTGKNTFYGKTAAMLTDSGGRSNLQILLLKIIIVLCILAFTLVTAAFVYLYHWRHQSLKVAASFAVVVIVASIPMGIEIVTTTTLAIGSKTLSKSGVIVSRLAAIDDLAGLNMLCSDKTGTLTKNKMTIQDDAPTYEPNLTQMDLLKQAALAAKWDSPPKDALDTLFLRCHLWEPSVTKELNDVISKNLTMPQTERDEFYNSRIYNALQKALSDYESLAFMPFDPRVKRTESTIRQKSTGSIFKVTKGAPHILHKLDHDEHKGSLMDKKVVELGEDGIRAVAIAVSEPINDQWRAGVKPEEQNINAVWHITGMLTFLDPPRDDTKDTIARSQAYGVPVRMITGDHLLIAKKTCKDLAMGNMDRPGWPMIQGPEELPILDKDGKPPSNLVRDFGSHIRDADGFAQVFPEHKYLVVETFRQLGYKCGMTGDGVNDAPALKRADVGIAVAGATDAARASADIVLTQEGLSTIILGMETARIIFARMKSFLTYRIAATLQLLTFFFIAVFAFDVLQYSEHKASIDTQDWPNFFSLPVILLMLITLINDGTLISIGYDYCAPSKKPERWDLRILFIVSVALGAVACSSSLVLLWLLLESPQPHSFISKLGVGELRYGQMVTAMFLKVAITDILTLFSARTAHQFFFMRRPNPVLFFCCLFALSLSTTIAVALPCNKLMDGTVPICGLYKDHSLIALFVWIYCILVFFVQDIIKVICWKIIIGVNLFNVNNEVRAQVIDEKTGLLTNE